MQTAILIVILLILGLAMFAVGFLASADPEGRAGFWLVMCVPLGLALALVAVLWAAWLLWQYFTAGVPFLT